MNLNIFWKQPAIGFSDITRGRTEEEICKREEKIGLKFPKTYRDLMKIQNGGSLKKSAFYYNGRCQELFYNGATLDRISETTKGYQNMLDILSEWNDEKELAAFSSTEYNHLERLPIISHMDGHSSMCFDYGWNQKDVKEKPEVCFFNDEFKEYLRIETFDEFVEGLVYYGYESCSYHFGIKSDLSISEYVTKLSSTLDFDLRERLDNKHGHFNFKKWYLGKKNIETNLDFQFIISPNRFQSGTYLFQETPHLNFVIDIISINSNGFIAYNSNKYKTIMKELLSTMLGYGEIIELLIPENVEKNKFNS